MITLITGSPGSGKTLYCVDKLLRPLIGTTVDSTNDEGETTTYNRTVFTNIPRLLLDHELIDKEWLENIHVNKVTGCVVVFDEVQRVWPNRPSMSKKPAAVEYLETHRHDGIDIIIMTQNPLLLDPAVRALVGRHSLQEIHIAMRHPTGVRIIGNGSEHREHQMAVHLELLLGCYTPIIDHRGAKARHLYVVGIRQFALRGFPLNGMWSVNCPSVFLSLQTKSGQNA